MEEISDDTIKTLTELSRIQCTEEERKALRNDLKEIITYIERLKEVDTEGVEPCNHVLEEVTNVMREDETKETLSRETFLDNAPEHVGGMIKVPPVLKG